MLLGAAVHQSELFQASLTTISDFALLGSDVGENFCKSGSHLKTFLSASCFSSTSNAFHHTSVAGPQKSSWERGAG